MSYIRSLVGGAGQGLHWAFPGAAWKERGAIRKDRGKIRFGLAVFGKLHMDQPEPMGVDVSCRTSEGHKRVLSLARHFWFDDWVGEEPR